jgi:hypothetical protein
VYHPDKVRFRKNGDFEDREAGSLVRFTYFKRAAARSMAICMEAIFRDTLEDTTPDLEVYAVKGRTFHEWRTRVDAPSEPDENERWGFGKVSLATEKGREFWLECLGKEYQEKGKMKTTGVGHPASCSSETTADGRTVYIIGMPTWIWHGSLCPDLCEDTGDAANQSRIDKLLVYIAALSNKSMLQEGCEAVVLRDMEGGRTPWTRVAAIVSRAWDRAAQELVPQYIVEGLLGTLKLERKNPVRLGAGRGHSPAVSTGSDEVFTMEHSGVNNAAEEGKKQKGDKLMAEVKACLEVIDRILDEERMTPPSVDDFRSWLRKQEEAMKKLTLSSLLPGTSDKARMDTLEVNYFATSAKKKARSRVRLIEAATSKSKAKLPPTLLNESLSPRVSLKRINSVAAEKKNPDDKRGHVAAAAEEKLIHLKW